MNFDPHTGMFVDGSIPKEYKDKKDYGQKREFTNWENDLAEFTLTGKLSSYDEELTTIDEI